MNFEIASDIIESCSGFTEEETPVGEAWGYIKNYILELKEENYIQKSALNDIISCIDVTVHSHLRTIIEEMRCIAAFGVQNEELAFILGAIRKPEWYK